MPTDRPHDTLATPSGEDDPVRVLNDKLRELDAVLTIGRTLTSSLDLRKVLATIMEQLGNLLRPKSWSLLLTTPPAGDLVFELAQGEGASRLRGMSVAYGEGIAGWVAREQKSVLVMDPAADPRFAARFDDISRTETRSVLAVPLVVRGRTLGVIELVNGLVDRPFAPYDLRLVEMLAEFAAIAIENARNFKRVEELTIVDEHTLLYNARYLRRVLREEVERARRFSHSLSVLFFDLDLFKTVNDTHGHAAGTALLAEVADLLIGSLRTVDVPVRYGGDEFVIILPETLKPAAIDVASRLRDAITRWEFLRGMALSVHVTASFGVATWPDDAQTAEALLHAADRAMYEAKQSGRNAVAAVGVGICAGK